MDVIGLIGAFHPALVHLPIGGILIAVGIEIVGWREPQRMAAARQVTLGLSALGAAVAIVAGWLLADRGANEYAAEQVFWHRLSAFASLGLLLISWLVDRYAGAVWLRRALLFLTCAVVGWTGHQGGLIAKGEAYYNRFFTAAVPAKATKDPALPAPTSATASAAGRVTGMSNDVANVPPSTLPQVGRNIAWQQVEAIFSERCISCHNAVKRKGGIRLDKHEFLGRPGGTSMAPVLAGQPQSSSVFVRISLPDDHDERMPPSGPRLSSEQVDTIRQWILNGAPGLIPVSATAAAATETTAVKAVVRDPDAALLAQLGARNVRMWSTAAGLGISLRHVPGDLDPSLWKLVSDLGARVVHLDLTGRGINLAEAKRIAALPRLARLDLTRASLADETLAALGTAPALRTVVLVATSVRGDATKAIASLTSITTIYIRGSATTAAVARPGLSVIE